MPGGRRDTCVVYVASRWWHVHEASTLLNLDAPLIPHPAILPDCLQNTPCNTQGRWVVVEVHKVIRAVFDCTSPSCVVQAYPLGPNPSSSTASSRDISSRMSMDTGYLKCSAAGSAAGLMGECYTAMQDHEHIPHVQATDTCV